MKRILWGFAGLGLLAALGGFLFAWSGLYNVAATAGHWPPVAWLLHFAMQNSVETHAFPLEAPELADAALIDRGAGHYETGCAPCHGAPGSPSNRIPNHMLPEPPYLPPAISPWSPEQLFWIVKQGLKYTGMPAWPAQNRDDEVWAVTAFLLLLPEMTAEEYAVLAKGAGRGPPAAAAELPTPQPPGQLFEIGDAALIGVCIRCHGLEGLGRPSGAFPRLDILSAEYQFRALSEYASGLRPSGIMQPIAAALEDAQMERLARHYGQAAGTLPPVPPPAVDPDMLERGRRLATTGDPERDIPACASCHGLVDGPENPLFPALNGQYPEYLLLQLQLWRQDSRGQGAYSEIMEAVVRNMEEADMAAVARFYASLPSVEPPREAAQGTGVAPAAGAP